MSIQDSDPDGNKVYLANSGHWEWYPSCEQIPETTKDIEMLKELKEVERFARINGSKTSAAHPKWDLWAETWIAKGEQTLVTSIDNYHHARKIIKSCGKKCTFAKAGGNCVTIFFGD